MASLKRRQPNGMASMKTFFRPAPKEATAEPVCLPVGKSTGDDNKENEEMPRRVVEIADDNNGSPKRNREEMALSSNLRKGAIKKSKQSARQGRSNARKKQRTINGGLAEGRVDEGTKECKACQRIARGKRGKIKHDWTCEKQSLHEESEQGRISHAEVLQRRIEKERLLELSKPPEGAELHDAFDQPTNEELLAWLSPQSTRQARLPDQPKNAKPAPVEAEPALCVAHLKRRMNQLMENPTNNMTRSTAVPVAIAAGIEVLLETCAVQGKKASNELRVADKRSQGRKNQEACQKIFPPGTTGFTFPRDDKTKAPDHHCSQIEGRTVHLVRWEQNVPGIKLRCCSCDDGELIGGKHDCVSHGYATPMFDIDGTTDYAVSMRYTCNKCKATCKGNDGRILAALPPELRSAYPVDPRCAMGKETHLSKPFTRVMEKLMITHGNGEQLSAMLHAIRGDKHNDREEEHCSQAINSSLRLSKPHPQFEALIGRYSPSGQQLRDLTDQAGRSTLTSTGVSHCDHAQREMQAVGSQKTISNDCTFRVKDNYDPENILHAKCAHTIGVETGELASVVLVKNTEQKHAAHQCEQFARRPNVDPKVQVSDICPHATKLWRKLHRGVKNRLGWFHFIQRITKTLNKEHPDYGKAVSDVSDCLCWLDVGDLAEVRRCLQAGTLGRRNGEPCPPSKIETKARTYRENIRVWCYKEQEIIDNLTLWVNKWENEFDEPTGQKLFTTETLEAVREQQTNAKWVTDVLTRDELHTEMQPSLRSKTKLSVWVGTRGAESKLEKAHHALAHFANGGMRNTLADYLGMAGVALCNLKIRHRLRVANMEPMTRAEIPTAFQDKPHFTNHLRLSLINRLAAKAGLEGDVHRNVEHLPVDNKERFFSECLFEELERENLKTGHSSINRCLCSMCAGQPRNPCERHRPPTPDTEVIEAAVHAHDDNPPIPPPEPQETRIVPRSQPAPLVPSPMPAPQPNGARLVAAPAVLVTCCTPHLPPQFATSSSGNILPPQPSFATKPSFATHSINNLVARQPSFATHPNHSLMPLQPSFATRPNNNMMPLQPPFATSSYSYLLPPQPIIGPCTSMLMEDNSLQGTRSVHPRRRPTTTR